MKNTLRKLTGLALVTAMAVSTAGCGNSSSSSSGGGIGGIR